MGRWGLGVEGILPEGGDVGREMHRKKKSEEEREEGPWVEGRM